MLEHERHEWIDGLKEECETRPLNIVSHLESMLASAHAKAEDSYQSGNLSDFELDEAFTDARALRNVIHILKSHPDIVTE